MKFFLIWSGIAIVLFPFEKYYIDHSYLITHSFLATRIVNQSNPSVSSINPSEPISQQNSSRYVQSCPPKDTNLEGWDINKVRVDDKTILCVVSKSNVGLFNFTIHQPITRIGE